MRASILLIDDEPAIVRTLSPALLAQGYALKSAGDAKTALALSDTHVFDLVLLDLGLPDIDGIDVISQLRKLNDCPILVLSARHHEGDKVRALDEGADDYVNKPFGIEELLARVRAAIRRQAQAAKRDRRFSSGELDLDYARRTLLLMGEEVKLSPKEFDLLAMLCEHAGQVVTQRKLLVAGWNDPNTDSQYLRSYIAMLRNKIEQDPSEPRLVVTEPGVGYRLVTSSMS